MKQLCIDKFKKETKVFLSHYSHLNFKNFCKKISEKVIFNYYNAAQNIWCKIVLNSKFLKFNYQKSKYKFFIIIKRQIEQLNLSFFQN